MTKTVTKALSTVPGIYRRHDLRSLLRRSVRYGRERLPSEFWPPLCLNPEKEADDRVDLFEAPSITVEYARDAPDTLPSQLDAYTRRITGPRGSVYVFEDAQVVGRHPVVQVGDSVFSASWFGVDTPFFVHQRRYVRRNLPLTTVLQGHLGNMTPDSTLETGFLLLTERGIGFHHWFYEVLPKLKWLEQYEEATDISPTVIVNSPLKPYQRQSLELMGYPPESVLEHGNQRTCVDRLLLAPHPIRLKGNQLQAVPDALRWVGNRIKRNVPSAREDFGDRIYISRADADRRRVRNDDELAAMLTDRGFDAYEPGRLSLADQVRLFSGADVVVGPHGMAYTNLLYARDATLIELFPRGGATETYYVASAELGLSYDFLQCEAVDDQVNTRGRDNNLLVPVDDLAEILDRV